MKKNKFSIDLKKDEYVKNLDKLKRELYDGSTDFPSREYQGHMNYDIGKPFSDALRIATPYNQNQVAVESSPVTTEYELELIRDMKDMVGYEAGAWGYASTCGTISNIEALWIARDKERAKGNNRKIVLTSERCHYSIEKACKLLDLEYIVCKTDHYGRIILPTKLDGVLAIVLIVGTTEIGSVDDIETTLKLVKKYKDKIHIHVDAAWGGYFICASKEKLSSFTHKQLNMMSLCDSITLDPHKAGYAPYGISIFLLKNGEDRKYINCTKDVQYIDTVTSGTTVEGSRSGAMVTSAYFGHKIFGKETYRELMDKILDSSYKLKEELKSVKITVYDNTDLGMVLFRTDDKMDYLVQRFTPNENVKKKRLTLVSTIINDIKYFRVVIMDPNMLDYCSKFVSQFLDEVKEYLEDINNYIDKRVVDLKSMVEECDGEKELRMLIESGKRFKAYNGFEPSGRMHIAQAIITVLNTNTIIRNGGEMIIYIADWFAKLNNKMDGDLDKIKETGRYFIEVFISCGINLKHTRFIWASEFFKENSDYWPRVLDIATFATLNRVKRCCQIMGRKEQDSLSSAQIFYPCMQCADIFELGGGVDICQLGLDQRKVNMLAREYAEHKGISKPVILSHHMLMGLKGIPKKLGIAKSNKKGKEEKKEDDDKFDNKMSKSKPESAIFVEDSESDVIRKIKGAFCNDDIKENPIWEYIKYILFRWFCVEKNGVLRLCGKNYNNLSDIECDFPTMNKLDLKMDVAYNINIILTPVREHFNKPVMKKLAEKVSSYRVTR